MFEKLDDALLKVCLMYNIPPKTDVYYKVVREYLEEVKTAYTLLVKQIEAIERQNKDLQAENRKLRGENND